jgi:transposase-like protein
MSKVRTKQEQEEKKKEALKLYLQGMAKDAIARQVDIADKTINNWAKQGNWDELYAKTEKIVTDELVIDVAAEKIRSLKIIKNIESIYMKQLTADIKPNIKTSEFAQIQKAKWEILMPKTISQYNFMKQENQIGPAYTLEIINPNDDKHKVEAES